MADEPCAAITFDIAEWLLGNTLLSTLPDAAKDLFKSSFPKLAPGAGKATGKLCLVAKSASSACRKNEKTDPNDCCKFDEAPHLVVMDMPDVIKFTLAGAPGTPAVASVDLKLAGVNNKIHWNHNCQPPKCAADRAHGAAHLRVEGTFSVAGTTGTVGVTKDLNKKLVLECGD